MTNHHVSVGEPTSTEREPSGDSGPVYGQPSQLPIEAEAAGQAATKRAPSGANSGRFSGQRAREAGRKGGLARARRREQAKSFATGVNDITDIEARPRTRPDRTPLDALRDRLNEDPDAVADGIARLLEKSDPRALGLLERLYTDSERVEIPTSLDRIAELSDEQRRNLMRQCEEKAGPALVDCPHCGGPLLASRLPHVEDPAPQAG